jgi:hypothetical protein
MKNLILLLLLALPLGGWAQKQPKLFLLGSSSDSVLCKILGINGRLYLEMEDASPGVSTKSWAFIDEAALVDADLQVAFQIIKKSPFSDIRLRWDLHQADGSLVLPKTGSVEETLVSEDKVHKNYLLIWKDLAEDVLLYGGTYLLVLRCEYWSTVDCNAPRPAFTPQQRNQTLLLGGAGLAMIGVGQIYKAQKENAYQTYRDYWQQGRLKSDADPFFEQAKNNETSAKIFTYAGWTALGLDAAWTYWRWRKLKKERSQYDTYCGKNKADISLRPEVFSGAGVVGFNFKMGLNR